MYEQSSSLKHAGCGKHSSGGGGGGDCSGCVMYLIPSPCHCPVDILPAEVCTHSVLDIYFNLHIHLHPWGGWPKIRGAENLRGRKLKGPKIKGVEKGPKIKGVEKGPKIKGSKVYFIF